MKKYHFMRYIPLIAALNINIGLATVSSETTTFNVTAVVKDACRVRANDLDFSNFNPLSDRALDASSDIKVRCTKGTSYNIKLNSGNGNGSTVAARKMTNSGDASELLSYSLFVDAGHSAVWGDGTNATQAMSGTGTGSVQTDTVYGQIPGGQNMVAAGSYSDVITVTVEY